MFPIPTLGRRRLCMATAALALVASSALLVASAAAATPEWSAPSDVIGHGTAPEVIAFRDGRAEAVWIASDNSTIVARSMAADGSPQSVEQSLFSDIRSAPETAALTDDAGVVVTAVRTSSDSARIVGRIISRSAGPGPNFIITNTSVPVNEAPDPVVAADGRGGATIAWIVWDQGVWSIRARRVDAAGVASDIFAVADELTAPLGTAAINSLRLTGHGDGTVTASWAERIATPAGLSSFSALRVRRLGPSGPTGSIINVADDLYFGNPPEIAGQQDGSTTVVWAIGGNWRLYLYSAVIGPDGTIVSPEHICDGGSEADSAPKLQCIDARSGDFGDNHYNLALSANGDGSATLVGRPRGGSVMSWRLRSDGTALRMDVLESMSGFVQAPGVAVAGIGDGSALAMWNNAGLRISRLDNAGDPSPTTTFSSFGTDIPDITLPAVSAGARLPAWAAWTADGEGSIRAAHFGTAPQPSLRPTRMVAFGDSYSSGEGLVPEYGLAYDCGTDIHQDIYYQDTTLPASRAPDAWRPTDCDTRTLTHTKPARLADRPERFHHNQCHRSPRAYPTQLRGYFGIPWDHYTFVACSGAITANVGLLDHGTPKAQYPHSPLNITGGKPQIATAIPGYVGGASHPVHTSPDLITIGIGGNDAYFGDVIKQCLQGDCLDPTFQDGELSRVNDVVYERDKETFTNLRAAFPNATILAFGYPAVVGDVSKPCPDTGFLGWTISHDELQWIHDELEPALRTTIRDAATVSGVVFTDITEATRGHELCSDPDDGRRWINGLLLGDDVDPGIGLKVIGQESFHPNQYGHDAITRYVINHYTDGNGQLTVGNPSPASPTHASGGGPQIFVGALDAAAQQTCGTDCLQPAACLPGCTLHLDGSGFAPGSRLVVSLHSDPVTLGEVQVDSSGVLSVDVAVPTTVPPGVHVVSIRNADPHGPPEYGSTLIRVSTSAIATPETTPPASATGGGVGAAIAVGTAPSPAVGPRVTVRYPHIGSSVTARWQVRASTTRVQRLIVNRLPRDATVTVTCQRPPGGAARRARCPTTRHWHTAKSRRMLNIARAITRPLYSSTTIAVSIVAPGWIGRRVSFVTRRGHQPRVTQNCLSATNARKTVPC